MYGVLIAVAPIVAALAALSLLAPWEPVYDAWGWLVWGREIGVLELDTSSGPSWKPLPVVFTTAFAAIPEVAPELWLLVARSGWLAAVALAALLAARIAERAGGMRRERAVAAVAAGAGVVLLADGLTPWLRQFAGGLSEPLLVALVLGAAERALAGRDGQALALGTGAALIRPEVWPFLAIYAIWLWRREAVPRPAVLAAVGSVAVLWFVPDVIGSGSFLTGADRAREGSGSPPVEALEVLGRAAVLPLAALWVGAGIAAAAAWRRGDRAVTALAAGVLAWITLVALMAAGGYAGLPRFLAPAAGVVCALGGGGIAALAARAARPDARIRPRAVAAAVAAAFLVQGAVRAAELPDAAAAATAISERQRELASLVESGGAEETRSCTPVAVGAIEGQTALAWQLEMPIEDVDVVRNRPASGVWFERLDAGWAAEELGCPNSE